MFLSRDVKYLGEVSYNPAEIHLIFTQFLGTFLISIFVECIKRSRFSTLSSSSRIWQWSASRSDSRLWTLSFMSSYCFETNGMESFISVFWAITSDIAACRAANLLSDCAVEIASKERISSTQAVLLQSSRFRFNRGVMLSISNVERFGVDPACEILRVHTTQQVFSFNLHLFSGRARWRTFVLRHRSKDSVPVFYLNTNKQKYAKLL